MEMFLATFGFKTYFIISYNPRGSDHNKRIIINDFKSGIFNLPEKFH